MRGLVGLVLLLLVACTAQDDRSAASSVPASVSVAATATIVAPPTATTSAASATSPPTAMPRISTAATATIAPTSFSSPAATAQALTPIWSYPIGWPDRPLGDGFFIRHGYAVENTWYNPGYWHTGEDWYALNGDTAGAAVYAVADGEVVYAGSNYPGRVVIVGHGAELYSMYGHLDPALAVQSGQAVTRGQQLGRVLRRADTVPNHLHFEIRSFLTTKIVNGAAPRYGFRCGRDCAPGPGYWPIDAPELPSALGWLNPVHVIARRAFAADAGALGEVLVATEAISPSVTLWADLSARGTPERSFGEIALQPGARFPLLDLRSGPEATSATSALAYQLWYRLRLPDERQGWVQAAVPSDFETGSDGRPSTTRFNLYPAINGSQP